MQRQPSFSKRPLLVPPWFHRFVHKWWPSVEFFPRFIEGKLTHVCMHIVHTYCTCTIQCTSLPIQINIKVPGSFCKISVPGLSLHATFFPVVVSLYSIVMMICNFIHLVLLQEIRTMIVETLVPCPNQHERLIENFSFVYDSQST